MKQTMYVEMPINDLSESDRMRKDSEYIESYREKTENQSS